MNKDLGVLPNVLTQHAEEVAFLWGLRDAAAHLPHYSLADLAKLDGRVEANIDGLRIAGEEGWRLCAEALEWKEPGEVFAAAVLAFESNERSRIQQALKAGTTDPGLAVGLISALGWITFQQAEPQIKQLLASPSPALRRIGIAASAIHRQNPGAPLVNAISSTDPLLKARALRAAGELGLKSFLPEVKKYFADQDDLCRFSAAWSAALLAPDPNALTILKSTAESSLPYRERALQLAIRRLDVSAAGAWQKKLAQNAKLIRIAITAAGAAGDPVHVPWLIEQMKEQKVTRIAGEGFTMITGMDLALRDLERKPPEDFEAGPTENPEDEDVEMDPDEHLPWPDAALIAKWWGVHQGEFQKGKRYLLGKPIAPDWMQEVLRIGKQRQRAAAALELALLQPGQPLFNVKAPGFRQQQMLGLRR
ncbi:MAG TPA: TIGR02270 family protein [Acidobacteriota bacterium]|nr:TIGR02270 family protein [Acidobacteriota bacterium]